VKAVIAFGRICSYEVTAGPVGVLKIKAKTPEVKRCALGGIRARQPLSTD